MSQTSKLFDLIGELARKRFRLAERELMVLSLNHTEARLLSLLREQDGCAQEVLTAAVVVDRSNVGRSLKKLEKQGYIVRQRDADDRRAYVVSLTDTGRALGEQVSKVRDRIVDTFCQNINERDARSAVEVLSKVLGKD